MGKNVFQDQAADMIPPRDEWVVARFQGPQKPWLDNSAAKLDSSFLKIWEAVHTNFEQVLDLPV